MTKFAAFIFLLLTSPIWVTIFVLFGAAILAVVLQYWSGILLCTGIGIAWHNAGKEKPATVTSSAPKAPRETYGHIFTKPRSQS